MMVWVFGLKYTIRSYIYFIWLCVYRYGIFGAFLVTSVPACRVGFFFSLVNSFAGSFLNPMGFNLLFVDLAAILVSVPWWF